MIQESLMTAPNRAVLLESTPWANCPGLHLCHSSIQSQRCSPGISPALALFDILFHSQAVSNEALATVE